MATMQGVVVYLVLLALMLLGGIALWFRYRVFGAVLMVGSAALLVWYVAGAPI
jgi:hypothetical protein